MGGASIPIQEPRVFDLQRAVARSTSSSGNSEPTLHNVASGTDAAQARAVASWDPSSPGEKVDWYAEYRARHAPLSLSWLQQPVAEPYGTKEKLEIRGLGIFKDHDENIVIAPLDDGSVCLWSVDDGRIKTRSRPGMLFASGPDGRTMQTSVKSKAQSTGSGVVDGVSVDKARNKAYFAEQSVLHEVDLTTLQTSSYSHYPSWITSLSEANHPVPLTVGTSSSLHIHDARVGTNGSSPSFWMTDRLEGEENVNWNVRKYGTDYHRLSSGDPSRRDYAALFDPSPLSILHHNHSSTIYVAGRFPSVLIYDRRNFPKLTSTIHSGARLCSLISIPPAPNQTLAAAGEYNGKGSLELYPLSSPDSWPSTTSHASKPIRNRTSASGSKLLSLASHGTRLLFSDSDGQLKWVERDGSTIVRRWNINSSEATLNNSVEDHRGIFRGNPNEGDVAQKLLPIGSDAKSEVCVWTGEKIGVLGFQKEPRFAFGVSGTNETGSGNEFASGGRSIEGRDFEGMMRRALERQADEVRFLAGFGTGG